MGSALRLATILLCIAPESVTAEPQTIARPALSVLGQSEGSRFGESLGCSSNTSATGGRSVIAVGAPLEAPSLGGPQVGQVFIVDPLSSNDAIVQRLDSPSPVSDGEFGKAVIFIDDINGDSAQDLVVSQPSKTSGALFVFVSTISETGGIPSYSACGSFSGQAFLGDTLTTIRHSLISSSMVIAGSPRAPTPTTDGFTISFSGRACEITRVSAYSAVGLSNSRFGAALGIIPSKAASSDSLPDLLVGAPKQGGPSNVAGQVRVVQAAQSSLVLPSASPTIAATVTATPPPDTYFPSRALISGVETDLAGSSIAAPFDATFFGFGSPGFDNGRGKVTIANTAGGQLCTVTKHDNEHSIGLGGSLAPLGSMPALAQSYAFATFRSEPSTGGSIGLFGFNPVTKECSSAITQLNNCRADSQQEQGFAIVGGGSCTITQGSKTHALILVGSPGAQRKGLLDIYVDKDFLAAPAACDNSNGSGSDLRPPLPPIDGFPGSAGLPPPNLTISRGTDVRIAMPKIKPTFKGSAYRDAFRRLLNAGFSKTQARNALANVKVLYAITITETTTTSKSDGLRSIGTLGRQPPIKKIRTRRDRVTVRLAAGSQVRSYTIAYRAEFVVSRPKHVVLGATTFSRSAKIAIGG